MRKIIARNIQSGLIVLPFLMAPFARAQAPSSSLSTSAVEIPTAAKRWNIPVAFEYASSLHQRNSYERKAQESLSLVPTYKISENLSASLLTSIYKDDSNAEEGGTTSIDNTRLSLSANSALSIDTLWTRGISATFATNQALREQTSYQGGLRLSTGLAFSELFLGSSLQYNLSFTRNFHEFEITADGSFNVRETLGNSLELTLPLGGPVSFQTSFLYTTGYTYRDDIRTKFAAEANLLWQVTKAFVIAAGTSNEGNALGPNGTDSNIEFFNDNSSLVKLGLTYIL
jgi:hypothetical protein